VDSFGSGGNQWRAVANSVMNFRVTFREGTPLKLKILRTLLRNHSTPTDISLAAKTRSCNERA